MITQVCSHYLVWTCNSHHQLRIMQLSAPNMEHKRLKPEHSISAGAVQGGHLRTDTGQALKRARPGQSALDWSPSGLTKSSGLQLWCETNSQTQSCFWMSPLPEACRRRLNKNPSDQSIVFTLASRLFRKPAGGYLLGPLTRSMRTVLPEQELVVKNSSRLLIRATTWAIASSTLPFLLKSSFFKHCFFHRPNSFSMFTGCSCRSSPGNTKDYTSSVSVHLSD